MHYRTADVSDLEALVTLWEALAEAQLAHESRVLTDQNEVPIRKRLGQRIAEEGVEVATDDGRPIGFVTYRLQQGPLAVAETIGLIEYLFVTPEYRRRGIGSTLLARAESALEARGATVIDIEVLAENDAAQSFYEAHGYGVHRLRLTKSM